MSWDFLFAGGTILATAILSSLCTVALAFWGFRRWVQPRLEAEIEHRLDAATETLGDEVEARVRQGVADGLVDGVSALPSTEVVRGATRTVARSGADLLSSILGGGRREPPSSDSR